MSELLQKTFRDDASHDLTLRISRNRIDGRQDKLPPDMWWSLRWDDIENHLRHPDLPALTREAFSWAQRQKPKDAA